ncbi:type III secretion system (T3SS) SseB-like protein [Glaciihabitans tibetensis]|uniref:Type III secretion system (T3SS) SseB-like protein n=1 Tax=Glaciihabitans tibetensis TaxID=1266600 RepID=A0A2T0VHP3_9MICO|nr:SseB family protein [Glaciihabitans tibetensis]PRY69732.1 type III secretion system (T3SS) SseB-like protein [Glaciihabitans tibetensis]
MAGTDSAGVPWEGRAFEHNPGSDDDGSAPERLVEALRRFRSRELGEAEVVAALRESRLLIPLVAVLGEAGQNDSGQIVDKTQELSIVTVAGPDGRTVMPVFTSVAAMAAWNPRARPVPADAVRVALAAASEGTELVVLDPTSSTEFVLRRPALWAIAQGRPWRPCYLDEEVLDEFLRSAEPEDSVVAVQLSSNDPDARLAGAELLVHLSLMDGLDRKALAELLERLGKRWGENEIIALRVDSMRVQLAATS